MDRPGLFRPHLRGRRHAAQRVTGDAGHRTGLSSLLPRALAPGLPAHPLWLAHGAQAGAVCLRAGHRGRRATTAPLRPALARVLGAAGLAAYNWWVLVPFRPGLMRSPGELFSNLEVPGQPFATAMRGADLLSGVLLLAAFLLAGQPRPGEQDRLAVAERAGMLAFAAAGAAGAIFPQSCQDGVSAACRRLELALRLPPADYLHMAAGLAEFGAISVALACAAWRTRRQRTVTATAYRALAAGAAVGYLLLGLAYLASRFGAVMEAAFFTGFTIMAALQLAERTAPQRPAVPSGRRGSPKLRS